MPISRFLLAAVLSLAPAGAALACAEPPKATFKDIVSTAPTIFTFQVTSAFYVHKPLGGTTYTEYVVGNIRVVDTLKGDASSFKLIRYNFRGCGSTRISVGQLYLAATSQAGPLLQLGGMDQAILDLTLDFYHESHKRSPAVDVVRNIIGGAPVPDDFPREALELPLDVYPPVPPPPAPNN
jgi:hypothetical protein